MINPLHTTVHMDYLKQENFQAELTAEERKHREPPAGIEAGMEAGEDLGEKKPAGNDREKRLEEMMEDVKSFIRRIDVDNL